MVSPWHFIPATAFPLRAGALQMMKFLSRVYSALIQYQQVYLDCRSTDQVWHSVQISKCCNQSILHYDVYMMVVYPSLW